MQQYDIAIVGGGLVGASLAIALADLPLRLALIDAREPTLNDPRLFALNASSCQLLNHLGLWQAIASHAEAISEVHVSARGHFGTVRLTAADAKLAELGHVVPGNFIEQALHAKLQTLSNIDIFCPASLQTLEQQELGVSLTLQQREEQVMLKANTVFGADGTASTVREALAIPVKRIDHGQSALVTRTRLSRDHCQIAYERFHGAEVIAMLPLKNAECATIWSADHDTIASLAALSDEAFVKRLQQAFGYRLGRFLQVSKRHLFPLQLLTAEKQVVGDVFLLGNALHTMPPIAAQGFNLALYEVAIMVDEIRAVIKAKGHLSAKDLLAMAKRLTSQQQTSIQFSQQLANMFSHSSKLVTGSLSLGLVALNLMTPLKNQLLQRLLGRKGKVPALLLG
jgi:2-octaprenyl-6-methoxyphenol hydroxylase